MTLTPPVLPTILQSGLELDEVEGHECPRPQPMYSLGPEKSDTLEVLAGTRSELSTILVRATSEAVAKVRTLFSDWMPAATDSHGDCVQSTTTSMAVTTFPVNSDILRATTLSTVLWKGAAILSNNQGTSDTYGLSKPVSEIDVFLSHNWSISRGKKFQALILEFNLLPALGVSFACALVGCVLNSQGAPPTLRGADHWEYDIEDQDVVPYSMGIYCQLLGYFGFFIALLQSHECRLCRKRRTRVFLDKVCIHQTDPELKAQGIKLLGAFMRKSNTMLVLFTGVFCNKLWTIYELACFMYTQRTLRLVPVMMGGVVLKGTASLGVCFLFYALLVHVLALPADLQMLVNAVIVEVEALYFCYKIRKWQCDLKKSIVDLRKFKIASAECFFEEDRAMIAKNISSFMKSMNYAPENAPEEKALAVFESFVQTKMPRVVLERVGYGGFPYRFALLVPLSWDLFVLDIVSTRQQNGFDAKFIGAWVLFGVFVHFVAFPTTIVLEAWLGRVCPPQKTSRGELCVLVAVSALAGLTFATFFEVGSSLCMRAQRSAWWVMGFAIIVAFFAPLAALPYLRFGLLRSETKSLIARKVRAMCMGPTPTDQSSIISQLGTGVGDKPSGQTAPSTSSRTTERMIVSL